MAVKTKEESSKQTIMIDLWQVLTDDSLMLTEDPYSQLLRRIRGWVGVDHGGQLKLIKDKLP